MIDEPLFLVILIYILVCLIYRIFLLSFQLILCDNSKCIQHFEDILERTRYVHTTKMSDNSITKIYYTVSDCTVVLHFRHKQIQCTMKFSSKNQNYSFRYIHEHSYEIGAPKKMCTYTKKNPKNRHNKKAQKCYTLSLKANSTKSMKHKGQC